MKSFPESIMYIDYIILIKSYVSSGILQIIKFCRREVSELEIIGPYQNVHEVLCIPT
jgi:hypothetical protein